MLIKIFVYGTLKPGEYNYDRYCDGKTIDAQPAIVHGQLFHLSRCGYPAMVAGVETVRGFVLSFTDPIVLKNLDNLEGYQPDRSPAANQYNRRQIEAFNIAGESMGLVWTYLMQPDRVALLGGVLLPEGVWDSQSQSQI